MPQPLTTSRLANLCANKIFETFVLYRRRFQSVTRMAKSRFEQRDWQKAQNDTWQRIELYLNLLRPMVTELSSLLDDRKEDRILWSGIKAVFSGLIANCDDWDLAETYFNSTVRRFYPDVGVDPLIEFVDTDFEQPPTRSEIPVYQTFLREEDNVELVERIVGSYGFEASFADLRKDCETAATVIDSHLRKIGALKTIVRAEMVREVFYRNKAAYIVGRAFSGSHMFPLVIVLLNSDRGIQIDAVLLTEDEASIVFSFTRSYFHVDVERYNDVVRFLRSIMPKKRVAELYISLGQNKHGKTELYRDILRYLESSGERFEIAPGKKGMVMLVFTMPGYDVVFKLIKDRFTPPKKGTRELVRSKYRLVFKHDRAGRLVDAQEFEYLIFPKDKFDPALLQELEKETAQTISIEEDSVLIRHCYIERRMIPLDIFVREAELDLAKRAVIDYGHAIRDLAISNIFPGDMLLKNFGVTRHGRVVFYDYDELCLLTSCNFREPPKPPSFDEEFSAEPWFVIGEDDIFPSEFRHFLGLAGEMLAAFYQHHADLFEVKFWQDMQEHIRNQDSIHFYPYDQERRLNLGHSDDAVSGRR